MILLSLVIAAVILGGLAAFTEIGIRRIERATPPAGRFVEVAGGRLHLLELGLTDAPPVVLLHGASGNLRDMKLALGDRLARRYRVILIDRPGHGWSDRPDLRGDASPARQAALVHERWSGSASRARFWSGIRGPARSQPRMRWPIPMA
jgi:hypothetical protein